MENEIYKQEISTIHQEISTINYLAKFFDTEKMISFKVNSIQTFSSALRGK